MNQQPHHTEKGVEKIWSEVEKELEYVATYASPERRPELLRFLIGQCERYTAQALQAERDRVREAVEKMRTNLVTENPIDAPCNPRCHDSGRDETAERVIALLTPKKP
jgi:hypothetical protein